MINILSTQLTAAIEAIHAQNIAHCDIKPQNVLFARTQGKSLCVKLSDFGSAFNVKSAPRLLAITPRFSGIF